METLEDCSLKGRLMFTGSGYIELDKPYIPRPWALIQDDGSEVDLYPIIMLAIQNMHEKSARHVREVTSYSILLDSDSEYEIDHFQGHPLLRSKDNSGWSNISTYLTDSLVWLTGRKIEVTISQNGILIKAHETAKVFEVHARTDSSDCPISDQDAEAICGVSQVQGRCIFSNGIPGNFSCQKFENVIALSILNSFAENRLRPQWTRIGNCTIAIKKKEQVEV